MPEVIGTRIDGATALVTGAGGGIGSALVEALLEGGAKEVIALDRNAPDFSDPRVTAGALDITDPAAVAQVAARWSGRVSILINNAGVNANARLFTEDALRMARSEIEVNYLGTLAMMHAFAPSMVRKGSGHIVNLVSFVGLISGPGMAGYSASKAAAHMVTVAARAELAPFRVKVLGIYPQVVDTEMSRQLNLPKLSPADLAGMTLSAIESGTSELFPGPAAEAINFLRRDPEGFQAMLVERLGPSRPQFQ
ncbi:SDR family NAD(P)-dependent oxidoreductase [Seohaeicola zhoushanensis]|uniref:Short-chain dehydrogenase n=1 Tax=Seohaeicola zhoushanensis TaxID=1569283 RepID=A0A8J3H263_9RHOB|nr:SDR family NAD(P)-dependent oxidoreductase [Seohaeicola zhoushanensis]GHF74431.1 short-chain dehydrogenase [Seohaeicola zhoushanensis]